MSERFIRRLRRGIMIGSLVLTAMVLATQVITTWVYIKSIYESNSAGGLLSGGSILGLLLGGLYTQLVSVFTSICPPVIVFLMALALSPEKIAAISARIREQKRPPAAPVEAVEVSEAETEELSDSVSTQDSI